jgi:stalled ribosome rescue protein Dom34
MRSKIGLWIDSKKAVIVAIAQKSEEIKILNSNMEKYFQPSGGLNSNSDYGRKDFPAYDITQRDHEAHLKSFFDGIISVIRDADRILIFGPGQAKTKLKKRIEAGRFMTHDVKVEPADKMSVTEIREKVWNHYFHRRSEEVGYEGYFQPAGA